MPETSVAVRIDRLDAGLVAHVALSNPRKLNALGSVLMTRFVAAIEELSRDEALRAVVVTGAGHKAFVGGADIDEMATLDKASARVFIGQVHRCCEVLRDCPAPVIARIEGFALGAGLELAAACDVRVAADTASVGMPEVKLGMPSVVEAALLPMLIGWGRTRQLLLLGEIYPASEAAAWGLIERVVPAAHLDGAIAEMVRSILAAEPRAVRMQKRLIRAWEGLTPSAAIQAGIEAFATAFEADTPSATIARFRAGRKAKRGQAPSP